MKQHVSAWWPTTGWGGALLTLWLLVCWVAGWYTLGFDHAAGITNVVVWYAIVMWVRSGVIDLRSSSRPAHEQHAQPD